MGDGSLFKQFFKEVTCPVCQEYFTDPVSTECGHNFCRACLTQPEREPGRNVSCLQCREPVQQRNLKPNLQLANIVEISKKFSLQAAKGKEGAGKDCERHQEPLKLFCREDETPICVVCVRSKEHREHQVIPVDEAAQEYKEKIQGKLWTLMNKREKFVKWKLSEEQRGQEYLKQLEAEKQEITSVFEQLHKYFQEKEYLWLAELADLEKEVEKRQQENMTRLSEKISHFNNMIKEVQLKCQQPTSEFLQDIRSTLNRCQEEQMESHLVLSLGLEWRLRSDYQKSSILKKAKQEFEESLRRALSKVSVTLDPNTANAHLVLSDDMKRMRNGVRDQGLPDNPERFDVMSCVLGCERFTSGKHCWEVENLKGLGWWAVGVARESLRRKGYIRMSPNAGIWAVGNESSNHYKVWALTPSKQTGVTLSRELKKIRVFLDYEEGCVKFFNADTEDLIFIFPPASFSGETIRPFFWVQKGVYLQC